jgi:hypothetical protein
MTKLKAVLRLEIPKTIRLPMKGRPLTDEDRTLIANRYQLNDTYMAIKKELGCNVARIAEVAQLYKLTPRNPGKMGKRRRKNGCAQPPKPNAKATAARANAALQAAASASPMLHPYTSIQRLTAEYLGQMQGLLHNELVRVTIIKDAAGQVELTYDLVERHRQKWP